MKKHNDPNACGCCKGGQLVPVDPDILVTQKTKSYIFVLFLIPVIAMAGALGYYKFVLPDGVAAVVNGDVISFTELDAAVMRAALLSKGSDTIPDDKRVRYRVLDRLIRERFLAQEACNEGVNVTNEELAAAVLRLKTSSGLDQSGFNATMAEQYGSLALFETEVKRGLLMHKLMNAKAAMLNNDLRKSDETVSRWFHDMFVHATMRIALSEEWPDTGGGCSSQASPAMGHIPHKGACPMSNKIDVARPR